jgi:hypothetical protein
MNSHQDRKTVRGVITQTSPYYQATLEVEAKNNRGQRFIRAVKVRGAQTFSFPANFRVETVTLDPHFLMLRWMAEYRNAVGVPPAGQEVGQ